MIVDFSVINRINAVYLWFGWLLHWDLSRKYTVSIHFWISFEDLVVVAVVFSVILFCMNSIEWSLGHYYHFSVVLFDRFLLWSHFEPFQQFHGKFDNQTEAKKNTHRHTTYCVVNKRQPTYVLNPLNLVSHIYMLHNRNGKSTSIWYGIVSEARYCLVALAATTKIGQIDCLIDSNHRSLHFVVCICPHIFILISNIIIIDLVPSHFGSARCSAWCLCWCLCVLRMLWIGVGRENTSKQTATR